MNKTAALWPQFFLAMPGQMWYDALGEYARELGFGQVYLTSDHVGLYEKFGFAPCDSRPAPWDTAKTETVFVKKVG